MMKLGNSQEIECRCKFGFGRCVADMDAQQSLGGTIVCDTAEDCNFDRDEILKRCEYAESMKGEKE